MKPDEIQRSYAPGDEILKYGSRLRELYVIASGAVELLGEDGEAFRLLVAGEVFGEVNAIQGMASPYAARAAEESDVQVLDLALINRLCQESPEFVFRLVGHLASLLPSAVGLMPAPRNNADSQLDRTSKDDEPLEAFCKAILECAVGPDAPTAVQGKLKELSETADISMREAYTALHTLLSKEVVHIVDNQLTLLKRAELEALSGSA